VTVDIFHYPNIAQIIRNAHSRMTQTDLAELEIARQYDFFSSLLDWNSSPLLPN
jgi:hypothetical protein